MALLATTLLAACSKVPDGILSEKKMQGVLTDMLLAEAMVNVDYNAYKSDTMKLALYESVSVSMILHKRCMIARWCGTAVTWIFTWRSTTGSWPILINGSIT